MDESKRQRSSDSAGSSEEYVIVDESDSATLEPTLKISNNRTMNDLQDDLQEVMNEKSAIASASLDDRNSAEISLPDMKGDLASQPGVTRKTLASEETYEVPSSIGDDTHVEGDYTIFNQILYLGAASINAPRSETEIQRNMAILNSQAKDEAIEVSVSVPSNSEGYVKIYDASSKTEIAIFKIHRIIFCGRGKAETPEAPCFAFTSSHGDSADSTIFQCHIFRCQIPEAVHKILVTFHAAFRRVPFNKAKPIINSGGQDFRFDISLEIKEEDSKGNFSSVPREKDFFKLRSNLEKQLIITVAPAPNASMLPDFCINDLVIERCFGLLVASGRKVKHGDMNLVELVSMGNNANDKKNYVITGIWDPRDPAFIVINRETPKDMKVFMTVAIDLVIRGIQEPVRFVMEMKVRVYTQNERFWYFSKKPVIYLFSLKLKQVGHSDQGDIQYIMMSVDNLGEVERYRPPTTSLALSLSSLTSSTFSSLSVGRSPSITSVETPTAEDDSDDDEPLLSGSGEVSKDCSVGELELWNQVLPKWQSLPTQMPKGVPRLVKAGVPEALRGEVWQLLAGCSDADEIMDTYRILLTKDCNTEEVIQRDINRTFPAHEYFKESGGQDSLFRISRAYAVYDGEVGYSQGLSFLAAALLLHMPEEQAFCVMVKIMFEYGIRNLFKDSFELLHVRFYQLDKLMEELIPDLWLHFQEQGVESHMFASQWFLTLYTARFPLFMVFHYVDLFLLLGTDSVFQVAVALLQMSKKELLALDFEGILKYFRVSLPKKYRNEDAVRRMFKLAGSIKVKRLQKYEKEYFAIKEQEELQQDPVVRLERENRKLLEEKLRLDRENDDLAHELVTSKISMRGSIDKLEDKCDIQDKEILQLRHSLCDLEDERNQLQLEAGQVKELLKREVEKGDAEMVRNSSIIADYKQICAQLSERLDKELASHIKAVNEYKNKVASCDKCSGVLSPVSSLPMSFEEEAESPTVTQLSGQIRSLELELAQTKLALVESECKNQDMTHQLNTVLSELQASKSTWFQKTFTSLKERSSSVSTSTSSLQLGLVGGKDTNPAKGVASRSQFFV